MQPNIGISEEARKQIADMLNVLLADEFVLYTQTRNAHWNVEGADFYDKHKFFETLYGEVIEKVDSVAERARQLGYASDATLATYLSKTRLKEVEFPKKDSLSFIKVLLDSHETIIRELRKDVDKTAELQDTGTSDFLTGIMEEHEKTAWFLRAHL